MLRTSLPFWAALLAATAVLPATAGDKAPAKPLPPDLAAAAGFNPFLLAVELGAVFHGPEAKAVKQVSGLHPLVVTSQRDALTAEFGVPVEDLDRVVAGQDAFVLAGRKALDPKAVAAKIMPGATAGEAGGKAYHATPDRAVGAIDARTLVIGPAPFVKAVLEAKAPPTTAALAGAAAAAAKRPLFLLAVSPLPFRGQAKAAGPAAEPFLPLLAAKEWRATLEPGKGKGLALRLRAEFADPAAAKQGAAALGKALAALDAAYLAPMAEQMPAGLGMQQAQYPGAKELAGRLDKVLQAARAGLKQAAPAVAGNAAEAVVRIETDEPVTTAVLLVSLMPRQKKQ